MKGVWPVFKFHFYKLQNYYQLNLLIGLTDMNPCYHSTYNFITSLSGNAFYAAAQQQKIIPSHGALQHVMIPNPAILYYMILSEFFSMK